MLLGGIRFAWPVTVSSLSDARTGTQRCSLHHSLQKQRVTTEKHDEEDRHYNVFLNASYINKLCTESEVPRGNCWHFRTIDRVLLLLYIYG